MARGTMYGARKRTEVDRFRDAQAFVWNAMPHALLAMTPEKLCADKGVTNRAKCREIKVLLLAAQDKERRRSA